MIKTVANIQTGYAAEEIILVEDEPTLRESLAEYLTNTGYEVTAVASGLKFYQALADTTFQAAIIDLGLPDMDGLQLVEYVRNNTSMRCIILTARNTVDDRVSGYDAGADLYLQKPVDCRELASALASLLQRSVRNGAPAAAQWQIFRQNAALLAPSAAVIPLTTRELDFILSLAATPQETVPRFEILTALGYANDDFSHRALESLVRRLRRKIEHAGSSSPILTSHGIGYRFSALVILR